MNSDGGGLTMAVYARVSSEQQAEAGTVDSQLEALVQRAAEDGEELGEDQFFVDEGYSGATLVRPALGAIGIFTMIPIWNDLWFPLVISPSTQTATVTLGVQQFLGQFVSNWNAVLSSLTLAMVPILIFYLLFSRQLIRSITEGALK